MHEDGKVCESRMFFDIYTRERGSGVTRLTHARNEM